MLSVDDATLLLPRDARVVEHGRPAELLEAVAGVPLSPSEMLRTLTGCLVPDRLDSPQAIGDLWRTAAGGGAKIYLHRDSGSAPWRIVSVFFPGEAPQSSWRADYAQFGELLPDFGAEAVGRPGDAVAPLEAVLLGDEAVQTVGEHAPVFAAPFVDHWKAGEVDGQLVGEQLELAADGPADPPHPPVPLPGDEPEVCAGVPWRCSRRG